MEVKKLEFINLRVTDYLHDLSCPRKSVNTFRDYNWSNFHVNLHNFSQGIMNSLYYVHTEKLSTRGKNSDEKSKLYFGLNITAEGHNLSRTLIA